MVCLRHGFNSTPRQQSCLLPLTGEPMWCGGKLSNVLTLREAKTVFSATSIPGHRNNRIGRCVKSPLKKKKIERTDEPYSRFFLDWDLALDCLCGALSCARTALKALAGVDLVVKLAHRDSFGRALSCACAAGQALVGNYKSHDVTSIRNLLNRKSGLCLCLASAL